MLLSFHWYVSQFIAKIVVSPRPWITCHTIHFCGLSIYLFFSVLFSFVGEARGNGGISRGTKRAGVSWCISMSRVKLGSGSYGRVNGNIVKIERKRSKEKDNEGRRKGRR